MLHNLGAACATIIVIVIQLCFSFHIAKDTTIFQYLTQLLKTTSINHHHFMVTVAYGAPRYIPSKTHIISYSSASPTIQLLHLPTPAGLFTIRRVYDPEEAEYLLQFRKTRASPPERTSVIPDVRRPRVAFNQPLTVGHLPTPRHTSGHLSYSQFHHDPDHLHERFGQFDNRNSATLFALVWITVNTLVIVRVIRGKFITSSVSDHCADNYELGDDEFNKDEVAFSAMFHSRFPQPGNDPEGGGGRLCEDDIAFSAMFYNRFPPNDDDDRDMGLRKRDILGIDEDVIGFKFCIRTADVDEDIDAEDEMGLDNLFYMDSVDVAYYISSEVDLAFTRF